MKQVMLRMLASATVLLAGLGSAQAGPVLITSRALAGSDFVDWGQLGPAMTTVPSPALVTSNNGFHVTATETPGPFERLDEEPPAGGGWIGNFSPGDHLLWNNINGNAIRLTFAADTNAAGVQIQTDQQGTFTAQITVFDDSNSVLGMFTEPGNSTSAEDGSAIFIGVADTSFEIHSIQVTAAVNGAPPPIAFSINQLNFADPIAPVPEPSSLAILSLGMASLCGSLWQKRKRAVRDHTEHGKSPRATS